MKQSIFFSRFFSLLFLCITNVLYAQSTDLLIQKTGNTTVFLGQTMSYTITVSNSGTDVNNALFNDDFPLGLSNVVLVSCSPLGGAICPASSDYTISNTNFSGSIPFLPHGASVEFTISMNAPQVTNGLTSISNTATVSVPSGFIELDSTTNSSTWNTTLLNDIDIASSVSSNNSNSLGDCLSYPFVIDYTVQWINNGPFDDENTVLNNGITIINLVPINNWNVLLTLSYNISNVQWQTSNLNGVIPATSFTSLNGNFDLMPSNMTLSSLSNTIIPVFPVGDTLTLTYTLVIDSPVTSGCGDGYTYDLRNSSNFSLGNTDLNDIDASNNSGLFLNQFGICDIAPSCPPIDIGTNFDPIDTNSVGDCQNYPLTIDYSIQWYNNGPSIDTNTNLNNRLEFSGIFPLGASGADYSFPFNVTNVQWSTNSLLVPAPNPNFPISNGNVLLSEDFLNAEIGGINAIIPYFYVGDTFTLTYSLTIDTPTTSGCGYGYGYNISNLTNFDIGSVNLIDTFQQNDFDIVLNENGICDLTSPCSTVDLACIATNSPSTNLNACEFPIDIDYTIEYINFGPADADNVTLLNLLFFSNISQVGTGSSTFSFPFEITEVNWQSSDSSSTPTPTSSFLALNGTSVIPSTTAITNLSPTFVSSFGANDTLTLTYSLTILEPAVTGCGSSFNFDLGSGALFNMSNSLVETNSLNNNDFALSTGGSVNSVDLAISESVNPAIVNHLDTTEITILFQNASSVATSNATWNQILPNKLEIIPNSISCNTISGTTVCAPVNYDPITKEISQTIPVMEANSILEIKFKGVANSVNSTTVNLEANALINCFDCIPSTNFTQTTFQIDGLCELAYAGDLSSDPSSCNASDGSATILTFGPYIGNLNYEWYDSAGSLLIGQNSDTAFNLMAGEYTVVVSDDGVLGCQIQESIMLNCIDLNAPYAGNDSAITLEEISVSILVLVNDIDSNGLIDTSSIDLNPTVAGIQDSLITNDGFWYVDSFGVVIFTPNENFTGYTSINYTILDDDTLVSNSATIIVEVTGVNDPPIANVDLDTLNVNSGIVLQVLDNDSDSLDLSGAIDTSSLAIISDPNNGTAEIDSVTGEITYTPDSNFIGTDSFQYIVCDNGNPILCDSAWVFITVLENSVLIDNSIIAINDSAQTFQNEFVNIQILNNDTSFNSLIDIASLNVLNLPSNGTIEISSSGDIIYTPNPSFSGVDSFQYIVCDNGNGVPQNIICDSAMVYVYILAKPDNKNCTIIIPEGISPNSDGLNDFWIIEGLDCYKENKVSIYNRWGLKVFEAEKYLNDWSGINNYSVALGDDLLPVGTYFYILELWKGGKTYKGFIYLTR